MISRRRLLFVILAFAVLAVVGGYYFDDSKFNRAVDARRQPGSSFKPYVYLTALQQDMTPATMILDVPTAFPQADGSYYRPENYDRTYHGPVSLRNALARSYNIPAIKVMAQVGVDNALRTAHRMGINGLDRGLRGGSWPGASQAIWSRSSSSCGGPWASGSGSWVERFRLRRIARAVAKLSAAEGRLEVEPEGSPGTGGELTQKLAVVAEEDSQPFGDSEDHLTVGGVLEKFLLCPGHPEQLPLGRFVHRVPVGNGDVVQPASPLLYLAPDPPVDTLVVARARAFSSGTLDGQPVASTSTRSANRAVGCVTNYMLPRRAIRSTVRQL